MTTPFTLPSGTIAGSGRVKILKTAWNNAMNAIQSQFRTVTPTSLGGLGESLDGKSGVVALYNGTVHYPEPFVTPRMFSGDPNASAAENKAALDLALATGLPVLIDGIYTTQALTPLTAPRRIFGLHPSVSKLIFDTTGNGLSFAPTTALQSQRWHVHDLAFGNVNQVPAAFIHNNLPVNTLLERLHFSNCAATYCVDNESGYGTKLVDCVLSDVTGGGIRLRQNAAKTRYSYAASIERTDFTRVSGTAIDVEGANVLRISGPSVIESCGRGIHTNSAGGASNNVSIVMHMDSVYFETNTGADIEFGSDGSTYFGHGTLTNCYFIGAPSIVLNNLAYLQMLGCYGQGGDECAIFGGAGASVLLSNCLGFTHAGFTGQLTDMDGHYEQAGTPTWGSASDPQPVIGAGTLRSRFQRFVGRAKLDIYFKIGADTTLGTGVWGFGDAMLTALPASDYIIEVGNAMIYDADVAKYYNAMVEMSGASALGLIAEGVAGYLGASATPCAGGWAENDYIKLTITYRC